MEGPLESLFLVMAGRRAGLDDRTGEGLTALSGPWALAPTATS